MACIWWSQKGRIRPLLLKAQMSRKRDISRARIGGQMRSILRLPIRGGKVSGVLNSAVYVTFRSAKAYPECSALCPSGPLYAPLSASVPFSRQTHPKTLKPL